MFNKRPNAFFDGKPVIVDSKGYYKQRKTSKNRILNFIFKVFGKKFIYMIKDGEVIMFNDSMIMNPNTFKKIKEELDA